MTARCFLVYTLPPGWRCLRAPFALPSSFFFFFSQSFPTSVSSCLVLVDSCLDLLAFVWSQSGSESCMMVISCNISHKPVVAEVGVARGLVGWLRLTSVHLLLNRLFWKECSACFLCIWGARPGAGEVRSVVAGMIGTPGVCFHCGNTDAAAVPCQMEMIQTRGQLQSVPASFYQPLGIYCILSEICKWSEQFCGGDLVFTNHFVMITEQTFIEKFYWNTCHPQNPLLLWRRWKGAVGFWHRHSSSDKRWGIGLGYMRQQGRLSVIPVLLNKVKFYNRFIQLEKGRFFYQDTLLFPF